MSPAWCVFLRFYYYTYWFYFNIVVENFGYQLALVYNFNSYSNNYTPILGWENQHYQQNSEFSPFFFPMAMCLPKCVHWPILPSKWCFGIGLGYCGEQVWKSVTIFRVQFRVILCYFLPWTVINLDYWIIVMSELFQFCKIID